MAALLLRDDVDDDDSPLVEYYHRPSRDVWVLAINYSGLPNVVSRVPTDRKNYLLSRIQRAAPGEVKMIYIGDSKLEITRRPLERYDAPLLTPDIVALLDTAVEAYQEHPTASELRLELFLDDANFDAGFDFLRRHASEITSLRVADRQLSRENCEMIGAFVAGMPTLVKDGYFSPHPHYKCFASVLELYNYTLAFLSAILYHGAVDGDDSDFLGRPLQIDGEQPPFKLPHKICFILDCDSPPTMKKFLIGLSNHPEVSSLVMHPSPQGLVSLTNPAMRMLVDYLNQDGEFVAIRELRWEDCDPRTINHPDHFFRQLLSRNQVLRKLDVDTSYAIDGLVGGLLTNTALQELEWTDYRSDCSNLVRLLSNPPQSLRLTTVTLFLYVLEDHEIIRQILRNPTVTSLSLTICSPPSDSIIRFLEDLPTNRVLLSLDLAVDAPPRNWNLYMSKLSEVLPSLSLKKFSFHDDDLLPQPSESLERELLEGMKQNGSLEDIYLTTYEWSDEFERQMRECCMNNCVAKTVKALALERLPLQALPMAMTAIESKGLRVASNLIPSLIFAGISSDYATFEEHAKIATLSVEGNGVNLDDVAKTEETILEEVKKLSIADRAENLDMKPAAIEQSSKKAVKSGKTKEEAIHLDDDDAVAAPAAAAMGVGRIDMLSEFGEQSRFM